MFTLSPNRQCRQWGLSHQPQILIFSGGSFKCFCFFKWFFGRDSCALKMDKGLLGGASGAFHQLGDASPETVLCYMLHYIKIPGTSVESCECWTTICFFFFKLLVFDLESVKTHRKTNTAKILIRATYTECGISCIREDSIEKHYTTINDQSTFYLTS